MIWNIHVKKLNQSLFLKLINIYFIIAGIAHFKWDQYKKGIGIQIFNNSESLFLNETCYAFRSIVANQPFLNGVHYWEIIADRRTENELKIGITKNINFNYDTVLTNDLIFFSIF